MLSEGSFNSTADPAALAAESPLDPCDRLADTLLAEIAAGFQSLASIASSHSIPYPRFTLWLLKPETQQKLSDLSIAVASAARLTATSALPDIVRNLKATVEQLGAHSQPLVAPANADPLRSQSLTLRRHRAVIAASALLYRIAKFTVPCHRDRNPKDDDLGAKHRSRSSASLLPLPRVSVLEHFNDDGDTRSSTSPSGEVPAKPGVGAPAFPTGSSPAFSTPSSDSSSAQCRVPSASSSPTCDIDEPMYQEEALEHLIEEFNLTDDQVTELRKDPTNWLRANIVEPNGWAEAAPQASADDG